VLTIAWLFRRKGLHYLIAAFEAVRRAVPEATLHIVGNGPNRLALQAQIDKAGLAGSVILHGFVRDPTALLRKADIFALPSLNESFGLVLAEAREAGCAIVASHVEGIVEALDGGQAGILVPPRNHVALAEKLIELLSDPAKLQHWRERASRNLDWLNCDRAARETLQVYDEVLREDRRRQPGTRAARLL
jgi:glycosyltransferase involved in cell wall biosynthesis